MFKSCLTSRIIAIDQTIFIAMNQTILIAIDYTICIAIDQTISIAIDQTSILIANHCQIRPAYWQPANFPWGTLFPHDHCCRNIFIHSINQSFFFVFLLFDLIFSSTIIVAGTLPSPITSIVATITIRYQDIANIVILTHNMTSNNQWTTSIGATTTMALFTKTNANIFIFFHNWLA